MDNDTPTYPPLTAEELALTNRLQLLSKRLSAASLNQYNTPYQRRLEIFTLFEKITQTIKDYDDLILSQQLLIDEDTLKQFDKIGEIIKSQQLLINEDTEPNE